MESPSPAVNRVARAFRQLGIDTAYVLVGFPIAMLSLVLLITGFSLGVGNIITVVGIPILVGTLYLGRGFAHLERLRIGPVLRTRLTIPAYKRAAPDSGWLRRMFTPLGDGQAWLDLIHGLLILIPSAITFSLVLTWWSGTLAGLTYPLYDWAIPNPPENEGLHELLGFADNAGNRIMFNLTLGVFFALTLYPVIRACALLQANLGNLLLVRFAELREQVTVAEAGRDTARAQTQSAVSAEATALRRLERDIHDGPQQRLVRLAMDLGRAQQQFDSDPAAARATVAEAIAQTRETLDELRALSRGIAPPILVDRGLAAALTALAGRCTVPVDLETTDVGRLAAGVESTAYFVVAEALTNVAKHSYASECRVILKGETSRIVVTVTDDGVGGAHLAKGHGLTGLADRVHAAGGELAVESPFEGGTTITAELPVR